MSISVDHSHSSIYQEGVYLYSWGKNKNGELGNGTMTDCFYPTPVKQLNGKQIIQVSSGGKHTLLITKQLEIYSCGSGEFGVLGNYSENKMKSHTIFELIQSFEGEMIENVSCAEFHSLCTTKDGLVCSWGGNLYSKLGQDNPTGVPSIIKSLSVKKVIQISCGDHHSAALTSDNELYTWGGGGQYNHGQCGLGSNTVEINVPTQVTFFIKKKKIPIKVRCGGYHTLILCLDNSLYAFGKGNFGQCGYGLDEDVYVPKEVEFNKEDEKKDVRDICCGGEHSAILTEEGALYTFGHGYNGQLGHGNNTNCIIPKRVISLSKVKVSQVSCGWSHTMIITSLGYVYITGCNAFGELGVGDKISRENFVFLKEVSKLNVCKIFCGGHHSWVSINPNKPIKENFQMPQPLVVVHNNKCSFDKDFNDIYGNPKLSKNRSANNIYSYQRKKEQKKKKVYEKVQKSTVKYNIEQLCINEENGNKVISNQIKDNKNIILKILYTNLPLSSRHIRFCIQNNPANKNYKKFIETFATYIENNPSIVSHSLIESQTIVDDNIVEKYKDLDGIYRNMSVPSFQNATVPLGSKEYILSLTCNKSMLNQNENSDVKFLALEDIQNDKTEKYLSEWVLDFLYLFKDIILMDPGVYYPSFIELR